PLGNSITDRVDHLGPEAFLERCGMNDNTRRQELPQLATRHLRDASWIMEASPWRRQPITDLPRSSLRSAELSGRDAFYSCRIPPDNGAPILTIVGLPDPRVLRPHKPIWHTRRFHASCR